MSWESTCLVLLLFVVCLLLLTRLGKASFWIRARRDAKITRSNLDGSFDAVSLTSKGCRSSREFPLGHKRLPSGQDCLAPPELGHEREAGHAEEVAE